MNTPTESEVVRADCSTVKHRSKRAFAQVRGTGHTSNHQSTGQSTGHTGQHQQNPRSEHRSQHQSAQVGARAPGPPPSLEGGAVAGTRHEASPSTGSTNNGDAIPLLG